MSTRGTRITPLRLKPDLVAQIKAAYAAANLTRREEPYNLTSWIVQAITEKLAKLERGRKPRHRAGGVGQGGDQLADAGQGGDQQGGGDQGGGGGDQGGGGGGEP